MSGRTGSILVALQCISGCLWLDQISNREAFYVSITESKGNSKCSRNTANQDLQIIFYQWSSAWYWVQLWRHLWDEQYMDKSADTITHLDVKKLFLSLVLSVPPFTKHHKGNQQQQNIIPYQKALSEKIRRIGQAYGANSRGIWKYFQSRKHE